MKCPNCNKKMKESSKFELRDCFDEDGFDLDFAYMKVFVNECEDCKIRYEEDQYGGPFGGECKWILPEEYKPTEKQMKYAETISKTLDKDIDDLVTKFQYWKFIHDNNDEYHKRKEEEYQEQLRDIGDTLQEYGIDQYDLDIFN